MWKLLDGGNVVGDDKFTFKGKVLENRLFHDDNGATLPVDRFAMTYDGCNDWFFKAERTDKVAPLYKWVSYRRDYHAIDICGNVAKFYGKHSLDVPFLVVEFDEGELKSFVPHPWSIVKRDGVIEYQGKYI